MAKEEYVVLDIETTGLSKYYHRITEIAAVKIRDRNIVDEFHTLINPEVKIPRFITALTGIDDEMVKDAPVIKQAMPKFLEFIGDSVIVAHNATFDYGFLTENAKIVLGKELENERICTKKLASRCLPEISRYRLKDLCEYYKIENEQAHRAMGDTKATMQVFGQMLGLLAEKGITDKERLLQFERLPKRKCHSIVFGRCETSDTFSREY